MLEYSGERVVPGCTPGDTLQEHLARYLFAAPYAAGKQVLDLACGTGYGMATLLRNGASAATGVDYSADALRFAMQHFGAEGARFVRADVRAVPFAAASFDVITSFETIEHIDAQERFLAECRRVLRPGGVFICSSPNKRVYSLGLRRPINPFHVREFTAREFRRLLAAGIGAPVRMFAQHTMGLRQRVAYELLSADHRLAWLAPLVRRLRERAQDEPVPAADPAQPPEPQPGFAVGPFHSSLARPATFFVAVCERP